MEVDGDDATTSAAAELGEDESPIDEAIGVMADALDVWPLLTTGTYISRSTARLVSGDDGPEYVVAALRDKHSRHPDGLAQGMAIYSVQGGYAYFAMVGACFTGWIDPTAYALHNDRFFLVTACPAAGGPPTLGMLWLRRGLYEPLPASIPVHTGIGVQCIPDDRGDMLLCMHVADPGHVTVTAVSIGQFEEHVVRWQATFPAASERWSPGLAQFVTISGSHLCVVEGPGVPRNLFVDPVLGPLGPDGQPDPDRPWGPCHVAPLVDASAK